MFYARFVYVRFDFLRLAFIFGIPTRPCTKFSNGARYVGVFTLVSRYGVRFLFRIVRFIVAGSFTPGRFMVFTKFK